MRVQSLANAGLLIEADGVRLLCDPWFTDGAYQGAWAIWPRPLENPVLEIGNVDAIYISHIHPDHYDQTFLRQYLQHWGYTPILCGLRSLATHLQSDGFASASYAPYCELSKRVRLSIVSNTTYHAPFDTALAVRCGNEILLNLNDNPTDILIPDGELVYDDQQMKGLLDFCGGPPTVAYLPFTGASCYSPRFTWDSPKALAKAAEEKKHRYLTRFVKMCEQIQAKYVIPFAGEYWLQGPLAKYNKDRGQSDATDAAKLCPRARVPAAGAWFDVSSGQATAVRTEPYDAAQAEREIAARGFTGYAYERDYPEWEFVDAKDLAEESRLEASGRLGAVYGPPQIETDVRYLIGLLTGRYHWNDA